MLLTRILFAVWFYPVFLVLTLLCGFACLATSLFSKKVARYVSCQVWGQIVFFVSFIRLKTEGRENVPPGSGGFIVFCNHRSMLDIPAAAIATGKPLSWVAKASLGKLPVFGWVLKRVHMLVEREGGTGAARKMIQEATARLKDGEVMAIFPEGTRNKTGETNLLPFKKGAFILAKHTNATLLPVCVHNSGKLWPSGSYLPRHGTIRVSIGKPLLPNPDETLGTAAKKARDAMETLYEALAAEAGESGTKDAKREPAPSPAKDAGDAPGTTETAAKGNENQG
ncbi:MAG: 1-acyl-sn-glycerol-3-phosphate acyltransferase [Deltaproteobacteria bacterium]|jgi:1-acyl-sn-glycerol-3-phosphate acyltransferase|nr:1-acyl-sn-glycerol-3-phosphate acyltransferase [Deltaproteobacteria bacterium]